jgi:hypothetical protein
MANTTNYNWETPDDTDLVKDGAAAIRTLGNSVDTTTKALNPETTLGDIAYRSATSNTNTRLAIGSAGQVLTVAAGVPSWASPSDQTPLTTKGDVFTFSTVDARLGVGANGTVLTADSAETTGLKWAAPAAASFVGVMVNNSATQNVANTTDTFPTFNQEVFDTDAFHSTSVDTNRLTVPAGLGGYYLITGYVSFEGNATGYRQAGYRINGSTEITPVLYSSNGTATATLNFQHIANLSAGDYVEMRLVQSSGGTLFIYGGASTRFGMAKL